MTSRGHQRINFSCLWAASEGTVSPLVGLSNTMEHRHTWRCRATINFFFSPPPQANGAGRSSVWPPLHRPHHQADEQRAGRAGQELRQPPVFLQAHRTDLLRRQELVKRKRHSLWLALYILSTSPSPSRSHSLNISTEMLEAAHFHRGEKKKQQTKKKKTSYHSGTLVILPSWIFFFFLLLACILLRTAGRRPTGEDCERHAHTQTLPAGWLHLLWNYKHF